MAAVNITAAKEEVRGFDSKRLFVTVRNIKTTVSYSNLAMFLTCIT